MAQAGAVDRRPRPRKLEADKRHSSAEVSIDLMQQPGFLFRRLASHSHGLFLKLTGQDDVTAPQLTLLATLVRHGPLPQAELGRRAGIDKNTLAEMLRRMQARGLIARTRNETDRRSLSIAITPDGQDCLANLASAAEAVGKALLEPLPPEQRPIFVDCLRQLANSLDQASARMPSSSPVATNQKD
jgi:DNA-binding MarR family transcriptional regulator